METLETWNQMVGRVAKSTPFQICGPHHLLDKKLMFQYKHYNYSPLKLLLFFLFNVFSTVNWYSHRAARCRTPRTRATWDCRGRHGINLKKKQRKGQRHRKSWHRILKHIETDGPVDFVQEDGEVETAIVDNYWRCDVCVEFAASPSWLASSDSSWDALGRKKAPRNRMTPDLTGLDLGHHSCHSCHSFGLVVELQHVATLHYLSWQQRSDVADFLNGWGDSTFREKNGD